MAQPVSLLFILLEFLGPYTSAVLKGKFVYVVATTAVAVLVAKELDEHTWKLYSRCTAVCTVRVHTRTFIEFIYVFVYCTNILVGSVQVYSKCLMRFGYFWAAQLFPLGSLSKK